MIVYVERRVYHLRIWKKRVIEQFQSQCKMVVLGQHKVTFASFFGRLQKDAQRDRRNPCLVLDEKTCFTVSINKDAVRRIVNPFGTEAGLPQSRYHGNACAACRGDGGANATAVDAKRD